MGQKLPVEYIEDEDVWACPYCGAEVEQWETECWHCNKPFATLEPEQEDEGFTDGFEEDSEGDFEEKPRRNTEQRGNSRKSTSVNRRSNGRTPAGRNGNGKQPSKGNLKGKQAPAKGKQNSRGKQTSTRGRQEKKKTSVLNIIIDIVVVVLIGALLFTGFKFFQAKRAEKLVNAGMPTTEYSSQYQTQDDQTDIYTDPNAQGNTDNSENANDIVQVEM